MTEEMPSQARDGFVRLARQLDVLYKTTGMVLCFEEGKWIAKHLPSKQKWVIL